MRIISNFSCIKVSGGVTFSFPNPNETVIGSTSTIPDANGNIHEVLLYAYGLGTGKLYYYNEKYMSLSDLKSSITTYPYPEVGYNYSTIAAWLP